MKISTRTRYGARFLLQLVLRGGGPPVPLSDIARDQQISLKYLGSIASALKKAGIVRTSVGAGGGFRLALPPDRITLHDVFEVFDGPVKLVRCVNDAAACGRSADCVTREAWRLASTAMTNSLKSVTIADLARRHGEKERKPGRKRK
ncbi:MAG: RrF2 family transcriptional regulator [Elusimicrobiales bacterium]